MKLWFQVHGYEVARYHGKRSYVLVYLQENHISYSTPNSIPQSFFMVVFDSFLGEIFHIFCIISDSCKGTLFENLARLYSPMKFRQNKQISC